MTAAPLIAGPRAILGWAAFSFAVLSVPVAAMVGQLHPPLPHLARLPDLPLQTPEGRLIDSHAFLGEVLVVELAATSCPPGCIARAAALEHLQATMDAEAPVRLLSLLPAAGGPLREPADPSRWNALRVPEPGVAALKERMVGAAPLPDDALLLFDGEGSLRAVFGADEAETLRREAERLARGLPARAPMP